MNPPLAVRQGLVSLRLSACVCIHQPLTRRLHHNIPTSSPGNIQSVFQKILRIPPGHKERLKKDSRETKSQGLAVLLKKPATFIDIQTKSRRPASSRRVVRGDVGIKSSAAARPYGAGPLAALVSDHHSLAFSRIKPMKFSAIKSHGLCSTES